MLFCIRLPYFVQIGAPTAQIWRHIHFSTWRPQPLNTTSGFVFVDVTAFRKSKSLSKPNFVELQIFIGSWDINTCSFEIQTSAILQFYFRFRSRSVRRNLHVILHQPTEFRLNQSNHCGNMTSYPFLNMAAATAKYYFRFRICWCDCLQKVSLSAIFFISRPFFLGSAYKLHLLTGRLIK